MARLSRLAKKHRKGEIPQIDWMDRLVFREIEQINEREKRNSKSLYLMIEFPRILIDETEYAVVYFEKGGDEPRYLQTDASIVFVPDPEIGMENLSELKHRILTRTVRSDTISQLKPDTSTRDRLAEIMRYPPTKALTPDEQDLIWKFRFYLSSQKKALSKFVRAVHWNTASEAKQALELICSWAPMDVYDSLELLSSSFTHPFVRRYAVRRLRQANDDDLLLYLVQLVQALKYEDFGEIVKAVESEKLSHSSRTPSEAIMEQEEVRAVFCEDFVTKSNVQELLIRWCTK